MLHRLLFLPLLAAAATAQLDVPEGGARKKADPPTGGIDLPSRGGKNAGTGLDPGTLPPPQETPPPAPAAGPIQPEAAAAAGAVLDELRELENPDDPRAFRAADTLLGLGDAGLSAARAALFSEDGAAVVVGGRVLLVAGSEADKNRVVERLRGKLPLRAVNPLLNALSERDPTRASPAFLIELLDHPQGATRGAVQRLLAPRVDASMLPLLTARLRSSRSDTRLRALELIATSSDPTVMNVLVDRLGDPTAKVAWRAAQLLARMEGDEVESVLLANAFPGAPLDRKHSYALLALIEREDRTAGALIGDERIEELRVRMASTNPLIAGSSAAALAGVGFRSAGSRGMTWLDREVPHELVRHVSGELFHTDFSALQEPTLRRLALISGQSFGNDGAAWQSWWVASFEGFHAHRAVIDVRPEEVGTLEVTYKTGPPRHEVLRFSGPEPRRVSTAEPQLGRRIFLSRAACSDLIARLEEEGVFGAGRLPGSRIGVEGFARELEVRVGDQGKRFRLPPEADPLPTAADDVWFQRVTTLLDGLDDRNRWQRYAAPHQHATPRDFWLAEHAWWELEHTEAERQARLKALVMAHLAGVRTFDRGPGIGELERLAAEAALGAEDFRGVIALLNDESYYSERVRRLIALAVRAASDAGPEHPVGEGARLLPAELAQDLVDVITGRFGDEAAERLTEVFEASDPELIRRAATDERPVLRIVAAATLANSPTPEDVELLKGLLNDPDEAVEAAAVLAFAENDLHDADTEVFFRARIASPRVRTAALRAVGILGGEGAVDVLVAGLADSNQMIQVAAAEGLADLADPGSAALFVSMLARGKDSVYFEPARRGLLALGEAAWEELLRASTSAAEETQREAALLLAEQGVPDIASTLISILSSNPGDGRVGAELAILTAVDFREDADPALAWWNWWDTVVHDDALAWFRAACERRGLATPSAEDLSGEGTMNAALFLVDVMGRNESYLVERARRELSRLLGHDLGKLPARGSMRDAWRDELRDRIRNRKWDAGER